MHKSNIQLTRVELSTLDVTTKFVKSSKKESSNPRFHNLVSELEGAWKSRDKEKGGREEPEEHLVDKRQIYTTQDNQWTSKRRASSKKVQSKSQTDEDWTDKSHAMKIFNRKSAVKSR